MTCLTSKETLKTVIYRVQENESSRGWTGWMNKERPFRTEMTREYISHWMLNTQTHRLSHWVFKAEIKRFLQMKKSRDTVIVGGNGIMVKDQSRLTNGRAGWKGQSMYSPFWFLCSLHMHDMWVHHVCDSCPANLLLWTMNNFSCQ